MEQTVPIIFTPPVEPRVVTPSGRAFALMVAAIALTVLLFALSVAPSPGGSGTHERLGFQRCQFLATCGLPCPTCGMTTSYAHFVRGNWLASLYVQPMGFVLAIGTCTVFWAAIYIAITGRPIQRLLRQVPMATLVIALMSIGVLGWGWKILIYLRGMDGWST
jgi:hypothetical protein